LLCAKKRGIQFVANSVGFQTVNVAVVPSVDHEAMEGASALIFSASA
jgi:hypothetical protein